MKALAYILLLLSVFSVLSVPSKIDAFETVALIATVTRVEGQAQVLAHRSMSPNGPQPRLKYQGAYFSHFPIRIGTKVRSGDIIHTLAEGRVRLILSNGDQFNVGPATSFQYIAPVEKRAPSTINLFYGKLRALVSKKSDNNRMRIRTNSVSAGVRGTDFFIQHNPVGITKLSVLRGQMIIQDNAKSLKPLVVTKGRTAQVELADPPAPSSSTNSANAADVMEHALNQKQATALEQGTAFDHNSAGDTAPGSIHRTIKVAKINLNESSREELVAIQSATQILKSPTLPDIKTPKAEETLAEVTKLEKQSLDVAKEDIRLHEPDLFKRLESELNSAKNADAASVTTISELYRQAPAENIKKKPSREEIDSLGRDVYKKYFEGK
jgi:hypothetical protein